ncbi:cytochrome P450 [Vararia minispora EC-137]|uniref:Cytochrome P450 n=1 Tax=Vararia minispora EC-137 TaxID=1314806 RepID=A0ACB8Q6G9_9AGAM|nr:cytochrome P450 [Vararia minispora EC-137]
MAFLNVLVSLAAVSLVPLYLLVSRLVRQRSLWKVPGPEGVSLISGILTTWFGEDALEFHDKTMDRFGRIFTIPGFLGDKIVSVADTKALYDVLVKNQENFREIDGVREHTRVVIGGTGLLTALGDTHRKQRKLMTPAFSINHMRRLMPIFQELSRSSAARMREEVANGPKEIDIMDYTSRLALELIARAGFGHSFGAIEGNDEGYSRALKNFSPTAAKLANGIILLPILTRLVPGRMLRSMAEMIPWRPLHDMMLISDTMQATSRDIWEEKKRLFSLGDKSVVNEYGEGKDIMSILLKNTLASSEADERMTDDELLAQINTFTLAASDTTSNTFSRVLHLLALHSEVQQKLREELVEASMNGEIEHDDLCALPYLEAVIRETLRLYPPVAYVYRQVVNDAVLPLAHPYTDTNGMERHELFVPGGGTIFIVNVAGVNRDKAIWGLDAKEWKPERWLSPLPDSVAEARIPGVYANTLTFIGGGRSCIGFKFAQLEMKTALAHLIPVFHFAPPEKEEIVWRLGSIVSPTVNGPTTRHSEMPLRVSLIV